MKKTQIPNYRKNFMRILMAFFVIYPWITYMKITQLTSAEAEVFSGYNGMSIDFFLYHKGVWLIIFVIFAAFWALAEQVLVKRRDDNLPFLKSENRWLLALSGVFFLGVILSAILSKHPESAWNGSPTERESAWILIAYVIVIFAYYNYFASDYGLVLVKKSLSVTSIITIILSLVEYFYKPLLEIGLVQMLVAPAEYRSVVESMKAVVFDKAISLTFYNPSYYGGFLCLVIPFMLIFCLQEAKRSMQFVYGMLTAGLFFCVTMSNSTAALYVATLELLLVVVWYTWSSKEKKSAGFKSGITLATLLISTVLLSVISGNGLWDIITNANSATGNIVEERFEIVDILMSDNHIVLTGEKSTLQITNEAGVLEFENGNGESLQPIKKDSLVTFDELEYTYLTLKLLGVKDAPKNVKSCLVIDAGYDDTIDFYVLDNGEFAGVGQSGAPLSDIGDAGTSNAWKSFYGIFTGRGYAWVNSLHILKDTLFIGKGPGNFAYNFKQYDYVGMLQTHETTRLVVDKPHSAYLQFAIHLGVPAALAFFALFVIALGKGIQVYRKQKVVALELCDEIHLGAITSLIGFLLYSIINDSIVTVTPIACIILGLLLATTYLKQTEQK